MAITISYPTSASGIKNNQEILIDIVDFALLKRPEDILIAVISRVWYKGLNKEWGGGGVGNGGKL